jgi:pyruvate carboxylase
VQILGDRAGNLLHLYERDCSVQRRHQKVVEVAPAVGLDDSIRRALAEAAVKLAQAAGYYNAGTVEFLVDADSGAWYFIEVNPRIQVEHTVTEMVTGIDLVRCQIQVAQGLDLFGPAMNLPPQEKIPLYGFALQCRITTEDPSNHFVPDYGKIHTYRSPAGFGIRLDGGSAYSGAVITPYYDSLLVKTTAWGREFRHACQRMDRCLREFRVRGVKTNIPFLENVVNHPDFQAGRVTTGWLEQTPELFRFAQRKDRATKLLTYLGEVIVNQNSTVAGKPVPARDGATASAAARYGAAAGWHAAVAGRLGPEKFAEWTRAQKAAADRHHLPRRAPIAAGHARALLRHAAHRELRGAQAAQSLQPGDVGRGHLRRGHAVPARRSVAAAAAIARAIPNICFQMLLRASNAVGYTAYPDNAVEGSSTRPPRRASISSASSIR